VKKEKWLPPSLPFFSPSKKETELKELRKCVYKSACTKLKCSRCHSHCPAPGIHKALLLHHQFLKKPISATRWKADDLSCLLTSPGPQLNKYMQAAVLDMRDKSTGRACLCYGTNGATLKKCYVANSPTAKFDATEKPKSCMVAQGQLRLHIWWKTYGYTYGFDTKETRGKSQSCAS